MTPDGSARGADETDDVRRRRLREKVFGDVLPDTTTDERDQDASGTTETGDEWLRSNVPPHHG